MPLRLSTALIKILALSGVAALLCAAAARAEQSQINIPSNILKEIDASGTELSDLFGDLCLTRFPDRTKLDEGAAKRHAVALTADEVKRYLHGDPGRGWKIKTEMAAYVVTIEEPPYLTCAVRSLYGAAPKFQFPFQMIVKTWAVNNKIGTLQDLPPQHQTINGQDVTASMMAVPAGPGTPARAFMALTTHYPNNQVEIRLAHQVPQQ